MCDQANARRDVRKLLCVPEISPCIAFTFCKSNKLFSQNLHPGARSSSIHRSRGNQGSNHWPGTSKILFLYSIGSTPPKHAPPARKRTALSSPIFAISRSLLFSASHLLSLFNFTCLLTQQIIAIARSQDTHRFNSIVKNVEIDPQQEIRQIPSCHSPGNIFLPMIWLSPHFLDED